MWGESNHFLKMMLLHYSMFLLSTYYFLQGCGLVLDTRVKGRECWPHRNRPFCFKCNRKQISSDESDGSNEDNWKNLLTKFHIFTNAILNLLLLWTLWVLVLCSKSKLDECIQTFKSQHRGHYYIKSKMNQNSTFFQQYLILWLHWIPIHH